jgi:hypothetical protein
MADEITATGAAAGITGVAAGRSARMRARWLVHLALLIAVVVSLVPLLMYGASLRITVHWVVACLFAALIVVHLAQRRRTVARLAAALARSGSRLRPARRLAVSGAVFTFLLANVIVSGVLDVATGRTAMIPLAGGGVNWHGLSSLVFLGYLLTHVIRRRRRLRKSVIR